MDRRTFLAAGAIMAFAGLATPARAAHPAKEKLTIGAAINKAGRQRMLSQRMAKAWLMAGRGVLPERAQDILKQSITLFETQLEELGSLQADDEVRTALAELAAQWRPYRKLLGTVPAPDTARQIFEANEKVLAAAHRLTLAYEKVSGTPAGQLINLSGRQRMLSQRIAKFFLFQQWGINAAQSKAEMDKAQAEFTVALDKLLSAPQNTPRIKSELSLAGQQWLLFQNAVKLTDAEEAQRAATDVATTSERILEQMDLVVKLYEALSG